MYVMGLGFRFRDTFRVYIRYASAREIGSLTCVHVLCAFLMM